VVLAMSLLPDAQVIEELFCLAQKYPGRHPLQLNIKSKLSDVIIESKMKVSRSILLEAKNLGIYEEEKLVVNQ
jgi:DNA polymerase-3 subunit alpha